MILALQYKFKIPVVVITIILQFLSNMLEKWQERIIHDSTVFKFTKTYKNDFIKRHKKNKKWTGVLN